MISLSTIKSSSLLSQMMDMELYSCRSVKGDHGKSRPRNLDLCDLRHYVTRPIVELFLSFNIAHADLYHKETDTVIELKTTGSPTIMESPPFPQIRQLKTYMSLLNSPRGILIYLLTSDKRDKYFQQYQATWRYPGERQVLLLIG